MVVPDKLKDPLGLQARGFQADYKVVGNVTTQLRHVGQAISPTIAKAVAHPIYSHIGSVLERVACVLDEIDMTNGNKRRTEEQMDDSSKKARIS